MHRAFISAITAWCALAFVQRVGLTRINCTVTCNLKNEGIVDLKREKHSDSLLLQNCTYSAKVGLSYS